MSCPSAQIESTLRDTMLILEVWTQNLFEPATAGDLAALTGVDLQTVKQTLTVLRDLGYARETKLGFQQSGIKVEKFNWRSNRTYDQYLLEMYGERTAFRGPDGKWHQAF